MMEKVDWLYMKFNTNVLAHVCFEVIYNYVSDVSTDEIADIEVFYKYITSEFDDIVNDIMSKTKSHNDVEMGANVIHSICKRLSNIIDLPIDIDQWWEKKTRRKN